MSKLTLTKAPQFSAGDMITGKLTMSDGTKQSFCFLVNHVVEGFQQYSVDDGNGFIDGRVSFAEVAHFKKA
jgi:hypothetical protein